MSKVIAVDAMTAEKGIEVVIEGSIQAMDCGCEVLLVGDKEEIAPYLKGNLKVSNCTEVVLHGDTLRKFARKKNSSQAIGTQLVGEGKADAFVSAGNTAATIYFTRDLERVVEKTPIVQRFPSKTGYVLVGDLGAWNYYNEKELSVAGLMMSAYLEHVLGMKNPRVALLTNGTEESKGTEEIKKAHAILGTLKDEDALNFVGNMEPSNLFHGDADCFVADGYTGNMVLKTAESALRFLFEEMRDDFKNPLIALLTLPGFLGIYLGQRKIKKRFNRSNYGGALMLGMRNPIVITHGSSDEEAIANSIRIAYEAVNSNIAGVIEKEIQKYGHLLL